MSVCLYSHVFVNLIEFATRKKKTKEFTKKQKSLKLIIQLPSLLSPRKNRERNWKCLARENENYFTG